MSIESSAGMAYLLHYGLIPKEHPYYEMILDLHNELYTAYGCAFQQAFSFPYDRFHLRQGNVSAFLHEYYYTMAATSDRETYYFLEGYDRNGEAKLNEQAMWCMQTRRMLFMEEGTELKLLAGIPRWYMERGISMKGAACYFGKLDFSVVPDSSLVNTVQVDLTLYPHKDCAPEAVYIRLPHPQEKRICSTELGTVLADGETIKVSIESLRGQTVWNISYK